MDRRSLAALITLNLVLVISLAAVSLSPQPAVAQFGGGREYLMLAGEAVGRTSQNVVYIADTSSQILAAIIFNSSNNKFELVARRDLQNDSRAGGGGGRR